MSRAVWSLLARLNRRPAPHADAPTDAELLARYVDDSDAAAFELIVWRHGGLVLGACTRMLRDRHAAEDALPRRVTPGSSWSYREEGVWLTPGVVFH